MFCVMFWRKPRQEGTKSFNNPALDGTLVHRRVPPSILSSCPGNSSLVPIYTPWWREVLKVVDIFAKVTTRKLWPGTLYAESCVLPISPPRFPTINWEDIFQYSEILKLHIQHQR